jgi:hypothetical protein
MSCVEGDEIMTDHLWLAKALLDSDLTPRSYSGRFMYGKKCLGFVTDESAVKAVGSILVSLCQGASAVRAKEDVMDLAEILQGVREDSMGLGTIVYFPDVPWHDSYETGDEEEEEEDGDDLMEACEQEEQALAQVLQDDREQVDMVPKG